MSGKKRIEGHAEGGKFLKENPRLSWLNQSDIRPYVFVRPENRIHQPGELYSDFDWFPHEVLYKNPLEMDEVLFADRILNLEGQAFGPSGMAMPRWVFYDCAILPGFVAGFAHRTATLPQSLREVLKIDDDRDWTPLSLFIIIPTMSKEGEWVAHNLCSVNSLLPKSERFYGIGFLSKAFGLWYANVKTCCGMTQWMSPSIRLHAHYGDFEILTSYTPVHSYAKTLTYRVKINPDMWPAFFTKAPQKGFAERYSPAQFDVDPQSEESLKFLQKKLEKREGPFFLDGAETLVKPLDAALRVYRKK